MHTRTWLAANPDAFKDGDVDASLGGNPPVNPKDITQVALDSTPGYGYGSDPTSPPSVTSTSTVVSPPASTGTNAAANLSGNGAASVTRSGVTIVLAAFAAGFFLL